LLFVLSLLCVCVCVCVCPQSTHLLSVCVLYVPSLHIYCVCVCCLSPVYCVCVSMLECVWPLEAVTAGGWHIPGVLPNPLIIKEGKGTCESVTPPSHTHMHKHTHTHTHTHAQTHNVN